MKEILYYFWLKKRFHCYKQVNGFLYYLRKIPWLGKQIPGHVFQLYPLKMALFYTLMILSIPYRIFTKCLWLVFSCGMTFALFAIATPNNSSPSPTYFLVGFAIWSSWIIFASRLDRGLEATISQSDREFVNNFRLTSKQFFYQHIIVDPIIHSISYLPGLIILSLLAQQWLIIPLGLLILPTAHFLGYAIHFAFFQKQRNHKSQSWLPWVFMLLACLASVGSFFYRSLLDSQLLLVLLVIQVPLLCVSLYRILSFKDTRNFLRSSMERSLAIEQTISKATQGNNYTRQGLTMQEKMNLETPTNLSHLKGITYLNALLFQRYQRVLTREVQKRVLLLLVGVAGYLVLSLLSDTPLILSDKELIRMLPFTLMVMYAGSLGQKITQMAFVNCDVAMLHYPFYREAKTILQGFHYRFWKILKYNSLFGSILFVALLIFGHFKYSLPIILLAAYLLFSVTLLFSFHDLFIYYILQPFNKNMEVTNPLYRILNGALYWIAFLNLQFPVNNKWYILGLSVVISLYVGIGYLLLLKKAPKTFRIQ